MRRFALWLVGIIGGFLVVVTGLLGLLNTAPGFLALERSMPLLTDGEVSISGVSGRFPDRLRIGRIAVADPTGDWLLIEQVELDWSPRQLLHGRADIGLLSAARIEMLRIPDYPTDPEADNSLPVFFAFRDLSIARFDLAAPVAGTAMTLSLAGFGELLALDQGSADLTLERLDAAGRYRLVGDVSAQAIRMNATAHEPAHGLLAGLAGLPDLGEITAEGSLTGPWNASRVDVRITAGALRATAQGSIDLEHEATSLAVTVTAPAMQPHPDLAWRSVRVAGTVDGPFVGPRAAGTLAIDEVRAAGAAVRRLTAEVRADGDQMQVRSEFMGLRIPGPSPGLLEDQPMTFHARMSLTAAQRPVSFMLKHPLITVDGTVIPVGQRRADVAIKLPTLRMLSAVTGLDLRGGADLKLRVAERGSIHHLDLDGRVDVTGGQTPLPALIGTQGALRASARLQASELTLAALQFDGKGLSLNADGRLAAEVTQLKFKLGLPDLKALSNDLRGKLNLQGTLSGPPTNLGLDAALAGDLAVKGIPSGPFNAQVKAAGLPDALAGTLAAQGTLDGAPVTLAVKVAPRAGGALDVKVERVDWKTLHIAGAFALPKESPLPIGKVEAHVGRLEDLRRLTGMPLTGSLSALVDTAPHDKSLQARLRLDGHGIGVEDKAHANALTSVVAVTDPAGRPAFSGQLTLSEVAVANTAGVSLRLDFAGPGDALAIRLQGDIPRLGDAPARLTAAATLDASRAECTVSSLQAAWKRENLRLLRPARLILRDTVAVERLQFGLRQAALEIDGRISPALDLSADLRDVPVNLLALVEPGFNWDGTLRAAARLRGTVARPSGTAQLEVSGVQAHFGTVRGLPPLNLTVGARLDGVSAHVESRLTAGSSANVSLAGDIPFQTGQALELQADGGADLKLLDPWLMAQGRRVRGHLALNAGVRGTVTEPALTGGLQVTRGEFEDYAIGLRLSDMAASLRSEGDTLHIERFEARAGPGRIDLRGSIGLLQPTWPITLMLTAREARPLASDRMTVTADSNLALRGAANQRLSAAGNIHIRRAEIRIPEHIPATIAVLDVREPGASPPPPPKPGPDIDVDLTIDATDEIFVRGRGLDAEMYGKIHLLGTANNPQPNGRFAMRRGQFTLMGKTLTFSRGEVGFDGGTLTNPTLDFIANTTSNNITATLAVGGSARKPKITLTSVPDLPQDEILAQLLFGRGSATLSPLELAQIAGALASLTGVTSGITNPLETVRKGLGLDRLAVGSTKSGAPTLEAGRYVAPGVYLGAKQGFSGGSAIPQAAVQIDVTEGLKLEGTVGAGNHNASSTSTGASSAGVIYQFEY